MFRTTKLSSGLLAAFGVLVSASMPAKAQGDAATLQRVEITGSSIKRIDREGALPVQSISRDQIEASGAVSAEQFLQSVGVALQGNSNSVAASGAGALTGGVSGVSLRGLGSQRTLVLIDGKRVSAGGTITDSITVDINTIPASAIERIEILKDGASAIYGSDAIGGVINFIMRKDYKSGEVSAYAGRSQGGGGGVGQSSVLIGTGDFEKQRFNITLSANYQKERALTGAQRGFARSSINEAAQNDTTSGNTFPANIVSTTGSFATVNPAAPACPGPYSIQSPLFGPTFCRFDPASQVALLPLTETTSLMANGRLGLTQEVEGYGQFLYVNKKTNTVIQPVPLSDQFALPLGHPLFNVAPYNGFSTFLLTSASPFYPAAFVTPLDPTLPDVLVRYRSEATGLRNVTNISDSLRGVLGLKGNLASGWEFDASYLHTETKMSERANSGFPLLSKILPLLNSGAVNPFGPNSAAIQAQIDATQFRGEAYSTKSSIDSITAKVTKDLAELPGGPLAMAVGAEFRREVFSTASAAEIQIGDVSGYGGNLLPQRSGRNVSAAFFEVSAPFARSFEATAAARYDSYQGVGSRLTPKLGARWQPTKETLFRGAVGTGFRAPSLTELFQPQTIGVTSPGLDDPLRCATTNSSNDCATQFPITLGGNAALKPETARHTSLGFVFELTPNASIGIDWFNVDLKNTIVFGVDPSAVLGNPGAYGALITRGPCSVADLATFSAAGIPCVGPITSLNQLNQNFGQTKITGIDVDMRWRIATEQAGNFTLGLNGTRLSKYLIQQPDGSFLNVRGAVNPVVNGSGGVIPTWRHYLYVDWKFGPWNLDLAQQYQSSYKDLCATFDACPQVPGPPTHARVRSYQLFHLSGSYTPPSEKNLKITFGIRNLLNTDPPYSNAGGQNFFQAGYDPGYVDPRGRFFFAGLNYKFK